MNALWRFGTAARAADPDATPLPIAVAPLRPLDDFVTAAIFTSPHEDEDKMGRRLWRNAEYYQSNYAALLFFSTALSVAADTSVVLKVIGTCLVLVAIAVGLEQQELLPDLNSIGPSLRTVLSRCADVTNGPRADVLNFISHDSGWQRCHFRGTSWKEWGAGADCVGRGGCAAGAVGTPASLSATGTALCAAGSDFSSGTSSCSEAKHQIKSDIRGEPRRGDDAHAVHGSGAASCAHVALQL